PNDRWPRLCYGRCRVRRARPFPALGDHTLRKTFTTETRMAGETVTIETGAGSFTAYVARPAAAKAPAIVVIQEIFGVNAVMRQITDDLAAQGYLAICPDLFWRIEPGIDITDQSEAEWAKAFELFNAFDVDKGVEDIQATIDKVRADPG